jgi:hypothetical protein
MKSIEQFQDLVFDLEQYKQEIGVRARADVIEDPDCAEVISRMETMVQEEPEIVAFYAGALKKYKKGNPDSISEEISVIGDRLSFMKADDVIDEKTYKSAGEKLATGELVVEEADLFFKMFRKQIPEDVVPKKVVVASSAPKPQPKLPRQAREINLEITQHGGIRVNGTYLRALTEAQKLIILSGLAKGSGFRNVEVYSTGEFAEAVAADLGDESLSDRYKREFEALDEYLTENHARRLLDPKRVKHARRHEIVAQSVVDLRSAKFTQRTPTRPTPNVRSMTDDQPVDVSRGREARRMRAIERVHNSEFIISPELLAEGQRIVMTLLGEQGRVKRSHAAAVLMNKLDLAADQAPKLMAAIYDIETKQDAPAFRQVRDSETNAKILETSTVSTEEPTEKIIRYGDQFEGTAEQFEAQMGAVVSASLTGVTYENGFIRFSPLEQKLLDLLRGRGESIRSTKNLTPLLSTVHPDVSTADIRGAVENINTLAGKQILAVLLPSKSKASKGPRIQRLISLG